MKGLSILYLLTLSVHVFCWRDSYLTNNNVDLKPNQKYSDQFRDRPEEAPPDYYNNDHISGSFEDEDGPDYRDRVIFPDTKIDYQKLYKPTTTTTTTSTTHSPVRDVLSCIVNCNTNPDFDPVCGTDNVTYYNLERLQCAIKCGVDVRLRQLSECPRRDSEITTPSTSKIRSDQLQSCMWSCPSTHEYNPVCGTNDVTYRNLGELTCAQYCGVDVQFKRHFPCPKHGIDSEPSTISTTTDRSISSNQLSRETISCIHSCPSTSEYNPVCGSNGNTYSNSGKLDCARYCGVDVILVKHSPCYLPDNNESTMTTSTQRTVPTISQDILDQIFNNRDDEIDVRIRNDS